QRRGATRRLGGEVELDARRRSGSDLDLAAQHAVLEDALVDVVVLTQSQPREERQRIGGEEALAHRVLETPRRQVGDAERTGRSAERLPGEVAGAAQLVRLRLQHDQVALRGWRAVLVQAANERGGARKTQLDLVRPRWHACGRGGVARELGTHLERIILRAI